MYNISQDYKLSLFSQEGKWNIKKSIEYESTLSSKILLLARDCVPPSVAYLINQMILTINLYFVSKLNQTEIFDGIGFGNSWMNLTFINCLLSLNIGFLAIGSVAYGAKNYKLLGLYYHRAILIGALICIPCSILALYSESIFIYLNIKSTIAKHAKNYMISLLPSTYILMSTDVTKNFLYAQNCFFPPVIIQFIISMIHPLWCMIFVPKFGYYGVSLAVTITQSIYLIILFSYVQYKQITPEAWFWFQNNSFENISQQLQKQINIGCPLYFEFITYEGMLIIAGSLSDEEMAAQLIFFTLTCFLYFLTYGLGVAANTYLSNSMGKGSQDEAIEFTKAGLVLYVITVLLAEFFLYYYTDDFSRIYSSDEVVNYFVRKTGNIYMIILPFDFLSAFLSALLRGIGKEKIASMMFFASFMLFALPLSYILALKMGFGVVGLWIGIGFGACLLIIMQLIIFIKINWEDQIMLIKKEFAAEDENKTQTYEMFSIQNNE